MQMVHKHAHIRWQWDFFFFPFFHRLTWQGVVLWNFVESLSKCKSIYFSWTCVCPQKSPSVLGIPSSWVHPVAQTCVLGPQLWRGGLLSSCWKNLLHIEEESRQGCDKGAVTVVSQGSHLREELFPLSDLGGNERPQSTLSWVSTLACFSHLCTWQLGLNESSSMYNSRPLLLGLAAEVSVVFVQEKTVMLMHPWREVLGCRHSQGWPQCRETAVCGASTPLPQRGLLASCPPEAQPHAAHTQKTDPGRTSDQTPAHLGPPGGWIHPDVLATV